MIIILYWNFLPYLAQLLASNEFCSIRLVLIGTWLIFKHDNCNWTGVTDFCFVTRFKMKKIFKKKSNIHHFWRRKQCWSRRMSCLRYFKLHMFEQNTTTRIFITESMLNKNVNFFYQCLHLKKWFFGLDLILSLMKRIFHTDW